MAKACFKDKDVMVGNQIVNLKAGQFVFGRRKAALELNMAERTVYDKMKALQISQNIVMESNNKYSLVTIVNWEFYQGVEEYSNNKPTTNQQQTNTNKNEKNVKNNIFNRTRANNNRILNFEQRNEYDFEAIERGMSST